ncbi:5493_t:CDS:2, partial [Dentiscutata heterogama]
KTKITDNDRHIAKNQKLYESITPHTSRASTVNSTNEVQIYSDCEFPLKPAILDVEKSGRIKVEENFEDFTQLLKNTATLWNGSLTKGELVQFIGAVIIKPLYSRYQNSSILSTIVNKSNLYMKDQLPQPFAEKIVDHSNFTKHSIYTMNDLESASDVS